MKTFKLGDVVFDSDAKEFVKLTNAVCPVCADTTLPTPRPAHVCEEAAYPSEAIALRITGSVEVQGTGKNKHKTERHLVLAWTYRGVRPEALRAVGAGSTQSFEMSLEAVKNSKYAIGRI